MPNANLRHPRATLATSYLELLWPRVFAVRRAARPPRVGVMELHLADEQRFDDAVAARAEAPLLVPLATAAARHAAAHAHAPTDDAPRARNTTKRAFREREERCARARDGARERTERACPRSAESTDDAMRGLRLCACARACARACVRLFVRACVRA